jgi:alkylhydroperoxidase family enzyme
VLGGCAEADDEAVGPRHLGPRRPATSYTEQEQAALALTEEMTDLTRRHVSDEVYARAAVPFSERELGQDIAMALTINVWNRIGVTTR